MNINKKFLILETFEEYLNTPPTMEEYYNLNLAARTKRKEKEFRKQAREKKNE